MAAPATTPARWLVGPGTDLLLGCGLLYAALLVAMLVGDNWFLANTPGYLPALLVLMFSAPHYGATLMRVYEQRSERRRYAIFAIWATLAILAWFIAGQHVPILGAALLTLYVTWSPWHYTGQNFGISVTLLRRRGVALSGAPRRALHASFTTSFVLFVAAMHESTSWATSRQLPLSGDQVRFIGLGTPEMLTVLAAIAWVGSTLCAIVLVLRRASLRDAFPGLLLLLTQALWFSIPAATRHWKVSQLGAPLDPQTNVYFMYWIAVAHSIQYLWITRHYAKGSSGWSGSTGYFTRTFLAGTALWALPVVIFSPDVVGGVGYEVGLALLVAAAVNVHHFVLDGAVWKLRDGPVARLLIRDDTLTKTPSSGSERSLARRVIWTIAGSSAAVAIFVFAAESLGVPSAIERGDAPAAEAWLDALAWVGRDASVPRGQVAVLHFQKGNTDAALSQLERSVSLRPSTAGYGAIIELLIQSGRTKEAEIVGERLLAFAPDNPQAMALIAQALAGVGRRQESDALLERARRLADENGERREQPSGRALVY